MRPVVRSGSVRRSVGEDGLELSMGVRPGPLLASSERRMVTICAPLRHLNKGFLFLRYRVFRICNAPVYPANAVVTI